MVKYLYKTPQLFILVLAKQPTLTNWTSGNPEILAGANVTLTCKSSPTRPAVSVEWRKGTTSLESVQEMKISDGLVTVLSRITFVPEISDNSVNLSCATAIENQPLQLVQQKITVWCK